MLSEKERALLGDREAQEAVTARGELLPCHGCGFRAEIKTLKRGIFKKRIYFYALCPYCRNSSGVSLEKRDVIKCWNHRAIYGSGTNDGNMRDGFIWGVDWLRQPAEED